MLPAILGLGGFCLGDGQRLLAGRAKNESDVRARVIEQTRDRVGDP